MALDPASVIAVVLFTAAILFLSLEKFENHSGKRKSLNKSANSSGTTMNIEAGSGSGEDGSRRGSGERKKIVIEEGGREDINVQDIRQADLDEFIRLLADLDLEALASEPEENLEKIFVRARSVMETEKEELEKLENLKQAVENIDLEARSILKGGISKDKTEQLAEMSSQAREDFDRLADTEREDEAEVLQEVALLEKESRRAANAYKITTWIMKRTDSKSGAALLVEKIKERAASKDYRIERIDEVVEILLDHRDFFKEEISDAQEFISETEEYESEELDDIRILLDKSGEKGVKTARQMVKKIRKSKIDSPSEQQELMSELRRAERNLSSIYTGLMELSSRKKKEVRILERSRRRILEITG